MPRLRCAQRRLPVRETLVSVRGMEPSDNSLPPTPPGVTTPPPLTPPPLAVAPPPLFYPPAKTQPRRSRAWVWVLLLVVMGGTGLWLMGTISFHGSHSTKARLDGKFYEEHSLTDKDTDNKIVAIDINGIITSHDLDGTGDMVVRVKDELELAEKDKAVKAVIIRVDSPGG